MVREAYSIDGGGGRGDDLLNGGADQRRCTSTAAPADICLSLNEGNTASEP